MTRREWLAQTGWGLAALALQAPAPVTNLTLSSKRLLTLADLTLLGTTYAEGPGWSYSTGQVGVRYVAGQRRLLLVKYLPNATSHSVHGNLCELVMPPLASTYAAATPCTVVRSWANWTWMPTDPTLLAKVANGWKVGGIWWDEGQGVVWYTMYPYYASIPFPFLGATALHDDGTVTKYGPWYYIDATTSVEYKSVAQWMLPIPPRYASSFGTATHLLGAHAIGGSGEASPWGPCMTALTFPPLTSTAPVSHGQHICNYWGLDAKWPDNHCHRSPDYESVNLETRSSAIPPPVNGVGYWQGSSDRIIPVWVETDTKGGLVMFGELVQQASWYGLEYAINYSKANGLGTWAITAIHRVAESLTQITTAEPHGLVDGDYAYPSLTNSIPPLASTFYPIVKVDDYTYTIHFNITGDGTAGTHQAKKQLPGTYRGVSCTKDPLRTNQGSTGFYASGYRPCVLRFDPEDLKAVAEGRKSAYATSMVPTDIGRWDTVWPEIAAHRAPHYSYIYPAFAAAVWDGVARQIIWVQAASKAVGYAALPAINVLTVSP